MVSSEIIYGSSMTKVNILRPILVVITMIWTTEHGSDRDNLHMGFYEARLSSSRGNSGMACAL
ncbi:hypothetical protein GOP47_0023601 [Adiantum capillus-veneris]|uniref:Uncharacterized protein n=1 Tax=Adiantum capillus-veneris TaxID=13818 RepID=A0A9D4U6C7_ADICA|nr:hypothetical protein GOP47_0023601 [Adiantum capillus-veneris]